MGGPVGQLSQEKNSLKYELSGLNGVRDRPCTRPPKAPELSDEERSSRKTSRGRRRGFRDIEDAEIEAGRLQFGRYLEPEEVGNKRRRVDFIEEQMDLPREDWHMN